MTKHQGRFVVLYEGPVETSTARVTDMVDDTKTAGSDVAKELVGVSVYKGEKAVLWINSWPTEAAAVAFEGVIRRTEGDTVTVFRVKRDYGGNDRSEAPAGADAAQAPSVEEMGVLEG